MSGATLLGFLVLLRARGVRAERQGGSWPSASLLFAYALAFSLAYVQLSAGTGALLLFGAVQLTMLIGGMRAGSRPTGVDLAGLALALAGLLTLTLPGARTAPPLLAAFGMIVAGVAWGFYSLRGRKETRPALVVTGRNFTRAASIVLLALSAAVAAGVPLHAEPRGLALAAISGALTSGLGYVLWYAALPNLDALRAGLVQLAVPVLTALGGIAFLDEPLTLRLVTATALVLAGIAVVVVRRAPAAAHAGPSVEVPVEVPGEVPVDASGRVG
ncbi:MAG: DMT family transporter [Thermoanaerobaculia bacterium]